MKINAITPYRINSTNKNNVLKQNYNNKIAFSGLFDVFQKEKTETNQVGRYI